MLCFACKGQLFPQFVPLVLVFDLEQSLTNNLDVVHFSSKFPTFCFSRLRFYHWQDFHDEIVHGKLALVPESISGMPEGLESLKD